MYRDKSLSPGEVGLIALLLMGGWFISYHLFDLYDLKDIRGQAALLGINIAFSFFLLGVFLSAFGIRPLVAIPAALWGQMAWNSLNFAHIAYLGYFMIPVEIWVAAKFINLRSDLKFTLALLVAMIVRLAAMFITELLRPDVVRWLA